MFAKNIVNILIYTNNLYKFEWKINGWISLVIEI